MSVKEYNMQITNSKKFIISQILILFLVVFSVKAQHHENSETSNEEHARKFEPSLFIIDHVLDSHEWHILHVGDFHLSVPLPVILYTKETGFAVFSSARFHNDEHKFDKYKLMSEGDYKGQIVEVNSANEISPVYDLSITKNVLAIFISITLMLIIFLTAAKTYKTNPLSAPKGVQSFIEPIIIFIRDDIAKPSIGTKKYEKFMPFLLTVFFFILINNLLGLIPIFPFGANVTGNIAVTMVLALLTFIITTKSGNKNYWQHIFNPPGVPWWLKFPIPLIPLIEFMGIFIKPFVLMVRLFANILAGHIIAIGFFSLIFIFGAMNIYAGYGVSILTLAFTIFMTILELLVAFIQAYVFTLLSALYFGMATEEHH